MLAFDAVHSLRHVNGMIALCSCKRVGLHVMECVKSGEPANLVAFVLLLLHGHAEVSTTRYKLWTIVPLNLRLGLTWPKSGEHLPMSQ